MSAIRLYTGLPGAGKTLRAIHDGLKEKENRPVFHIGIDGMKSEYIPECPYPIEEWEKFAEENPNSILIIDECHKYLPVSDRMRNGVPPWVEKLTEIRHSGIELWLVTQDPRNINSFVRRLIGLHFHMTRKAGLEGAVVTEFDHVAENPRDYHENLTASKTIWKYDKKLFDVYKSSTLHVMKPRFPFKVKLYFSLIVFSIIAIISSLFFIGKSLKNNDLISSSDAVSSSNDAFVSPPSSPPSSASAVDLSSMNYAEKITPKFEGIPWTAPAFENREFTVQPKIYCIIFGHPGSDRCTCYTEQVTKLRGVSDQMCRAIVRDGLYDPYYQPSNSSNNSDPTEPVQTFGE